jgi:hypothetical protein
MDLRKVGANYEFIVSNSCYRLENRSDSCNLINDLIHRHDSLQNMDPFRLIKKVAYKIAEQPYHSAPLVASKCQWWKRKRGANREKSGALFQKQQPFRRLKMRWTRISISCRQEKAGDSNPSGERCKHRAEPFICFWLSDAPFRPYSVQQGKLGTVPKQWIQWLRWQVPVNYGLSECCTSPRGTRPNYSRQTESESRDKCTWWDDSNGHCCTVSNWAVYSTTFTGKQIDLRMAKTKW